MSDTSGPQKIIETIETAVVGKRSAVELAVCAFLANGHLLIEDVPGVGKTTLAKAMARTFGGAFRRVQFTSDLLPSDIVGVSVWDPEKREFIFKEGPVFANLVLADEINRASPKTQSALLEAMSEYQVSNDGVTRPLPDPFMVIATQNVQDSYGTYPLPESQLDRFALRMGLGYTTPTVEREIVTRKSSVDPVEKIEPVLSAAEIDAQKAKVDEVTVEDSIVEYIMQIITGTRESRLLRLGAGPRGGMALHRCARALAVIRGRNYVLVDDVKQLAVPALAHRVVAEGAASSGNKELSDRIIGDIVDAIDVPV